MRLETPGPGSTSPSRTAAASGSSGSPSSRCLRSVPWVVSNGRSRSAIRAARAEPGRRSSSRQASSRTDLARSSRQLSRNGSSAGPRPTSNAATAAARCCAPSVDQVCSTRARPASGSAWRRAAIALTRSAACSARPSSVTHDQSGLRAASHRPRSPTTARAARRTALVVARSSTWGSNRGGTTRPAAAAVSNQCTVSTPRDAPPTGPCVTSSSRIWTAPDGATASVSAGAGSSGSGAGSATRPARRTASPRAAASSSASSRVAPSRGTKPRAGRGGTSRRAVPTRAAARSCPHHSSSVTLLTGPPAVRRRRR